MFHSEHADERSYYMDIQQVDAIVSQILESLSLDNYVHIVRIARMFHERDLTSIDQLPWEQLTPVTQAHYIRIAVVLVTNGDVRVDSRFIQ